MGYRSNPRTEKSKSSEMSSHQNSRTFCHYIRNQSLPWHYLHLYAATKTSTSTLCTSQLLFPHSAPKCGGCLHYWKMARWVRPKGGRSWVQGWSWPPAQDAYSKLPWDCQLLPMLTWHPHEQMAKCLPSLGHSPEQLVTHPVDMKY